MNIEQSWLWLANIKGIGRKKINILLRYYSSPLDVWNSNENELKTIKELNILDINLIQKAKDIEKINKMEAYMEKYDIKYVSIQSKKYPRLLKNIYDPPNVLYYRGKLPGKSESMIGVVGSRDCTEYGKKTAYGFSKVLSKSGVTVVSGMARGIDTYAHKGALEGGKTIAVLACGVDICYPKSNRAIMDIIIKNGAVISEFPPGTQPIARLFPSRNRIISGMSSGTLIVEAAEKSGSLITADQALEQGRDVYAVPGNIYDNMCKGTNRLIKQGAMLVTEPKDILDDIGIQMTGDEIQITNKEEKSRIKDEELRIEENNKQEYESRKIYKEEVENNKKIINGLDEEEKIVYACINSDETEFEIILEKSKLIINKLQHILTMLEIKGVIKQLPGKRFERLR